METALVKQEKGLAKLILLISSPVLAVQGKQKIMVSIDRFPSYNHAIFSEELKIASVKNIGEIFSNKTPALATLSKETSAQSIIAMLELFIIAIRNYFDLHKTISEENIKETARLILQKYYMLTITDIVYVLNQAKLGKYGEVKYSITGQTILIWFDQHFSQRSEVAFNDSLSEHLDVKRDSYERSSGRVRDLRESIRQSNQNNIGNE